MVVIGTSPLALLCQMCVSGSSCSPSASPERHHRPRDPFSTRPHVLHQTPIWSGPAAHFSFRCVTCFHPAPNPSLSIHNLSCLWMCLCSPPAFPTPRTEPSINTTPPSAPALALSLPAAWDTITPTRPRVPIPPAAQGVTPGGDITSLLATRSVQGLRVPDARVLCPARGAAAPGLHCFGAAPSSKGAGQGWPAVGTCPNPWGSPCGVGVEPSIGVPVYR